MYSMNKNTVMAKKGLGILLLAVVWILVTKNEQYAQSAPTGWETYSIPGVCSFAIPSTMEVRLENSFHGRFVKSMHQSSFYEMLCNECDIFFEEAKLVLQPKGLNGDPFSDEYNKANSSYGRIIFQFSYDDFLTQEDLATVLPSELTILDTLWRNNVRDGLDCMGQFWGFKGSFSWLPLRKENYSGLSALVTEYNRPGTVAETHVREYKFFYGGRFLRITTSYNLSQEEKYREDFKTFMQLLKIETDGMPDKAKQSQKGLFKSDEYHISFAYNPGIYTEIKKQNNSSHCFFKLESNDGSFILFSAWDMEVSNDDISIHDNEVVEEMKKHDKSMENLITNCEKLKIGNTDALMSRAINNVYGTRYVYTTYRVYYKNRLYTFDFHIPEAVFNKDKDIVNELIKGLQFN